MGKGSSIGRAALGVTTGGLSEFAQKNPFGAPLNNPAALPGGFFQGSSLFGGNSNPQSIPGPFTLDQNQFNADRSAINTEGQNQYNQTLQGITDSSAANTQRAADLFKSTLPDIAENSQAAHLYDSTGYGQEVARQQANIASQVAQQESQQKLSALSGLQGFQTGALQRGLSLEDFVNQANVAKTIGAQMAPQAPTGKQNFGTVAQGVGALSPFAKLGKGAAGGAAAGGVPGAVAGSLGAVAGDLA